MSAPFEDELIRHEAFLMRLARRLADDEAGAHDLVQDAFLRALERPPRRLGALKAWLATALRRGSGRVRRSERRRADRERLAARPEADLPDLAAVDARLDAHAALLALLRELPEGERRALFLRYGEDLSPPAIAARLGVPLETVRTRLARGRERLRRELDARHGGRAAWIGLFVPGSAWDATGTTAWTAGAPHAAGWAARGAAVTLGFGAGAVMGTVAKAAAGALVCAGAAAWWWGADGAGAGESARAGARERVGPAPETAALVVAESGAERAPLDPERGAEDRTAVSRSSAAEASARAAGAAPDVARWPLLVRAAGAPAEGAHVRVVARLDAFGRHEATPLEGVLDAANEARFELSAQLSDLLAHAEGARPTEVVVEIDHPDLVPAEVSVPLPDPLRPPEPPEAPLVALVQVRPAAVVVGRLVDVRGEPFAGEAYVQAHARSGGGVAARSAGGAWPDPDRRFRLRIDGEGPHALLAVAPGVRPATVPLALARGALADAGDVVLAEGLAIRGRALGADGTPSADARIVVTLVAEPEGPVDLDTWRLGVPAALVWIGDAFELRASRAGAGADGGFAVHGLGPYAYRVTAMEGDVAAPFPLPDPPPVTAPGTVDVRPQGVDVRVRVSAPAGPERSGVGLWKRGEETRGFELLLEAGEVERTLRFVLPARSELQLLFDVEGLRPAALDVRTGAVGERALLDVDLVPGADEARLTLVLTGAPVPDGTPFTLVIDREGRTSERVVRVEEGRIELADLAPGPLELVASAGEDRFAPQDHLIDARLSLELAPREHRRVPLRLELGGTLVLEARSPEGRRLAGRARVFAPGGEELDLVFVARMPEGRIAGPNLIFEGGPSQAVPDLAPGVYRVRVEADGHDPGEVEVVIVSGSTTHRVLELHAAR